MPSKKRCDELRLGRARLAQAPHLEAIAAAQHAGDRDHAVLLERQEVAAAALAVQREHRLRHLLIAQALEAVEPPAEVDVRHGLDIEHERVHGALISTATATMSRLRR